MLRRTLLRAVAVMGMLGLIAGTASAHGPRVVVRGGHSGHHHVQHRHVQQQHVHVHRQPVYATQSYGYGMSSCNQGGYAGPAYGGYGGYSGSPYSGGYYGSSYGGYGSSYGGGIGYGGPSFGIYYSR